MTSPSQTAATKSDTPGLGPKGLKKAKKSQGGELVGRSPGQLMWTRFKRDRTGVVCAIVVLAFFVIAALAPVIGALYGKDPYTLYGSDDPNLLDEFGYPAGANGGISPRTGSASSRSWAATCSCGWSTACVCRWVSPSR